MHYDVAIIGAGMAGLAAGIRSAYFDKHTVIFDRHTVFGGLNSFYSLEGRQFDVGLHAVTNYVPRSVRSAPLPKLLRQLRIDRDEFDLHEQRVSEIRFPGCTLRFANGIELLRSEIEAAFPRERDGVARLIGAIRDCDDTSLTATPGSARAYLREFLSDPLLIDMLLCGAMYYGSPQEHDMDVTQFVTMFKSLYLEGLARPRDGVRTIIRTLVKKYRQCGGTFRMGCGVRRIVNDGSAVTGLELDSGDVVTADVVLSSAGLLETHRLIEGSPVRENLSDIGQVSFVESISILDTTPAALGIDSAIIFFNDAATFTYARPDGLIDPRSGVICCPNNYEGHEDMPEGVLRITSLANFDRWSTLADPEYRAAKREAYERTSERVVRLIPDFRPHVRYNDMFTPRTIRKFTGHINGAVYGSPRKVRDGRTPLKNLFVCGTDQGFWGIIGAMLSGVTIANLYVLSER